MCFPGEAGLSMRQVGLFSYLSSSDSFHHIGRRPLGQQFFLHEVHVGSYMAEEPVVPLAQIVQAGLARGCAHEAVLGALAVAGEEVFAFPTLGGEAFLLPIAELLLTFAIHHFYQSLVVDVA